ncbi:MAG: glutathione S-transferase family protein [Candidatus Binatia bacterium]
MSDFTLYHFLMSVCSMKARLALEEKGVPWKSHDVDIGFKLEHLDPWYIKMNPRGVVPTLQDGDKIITDAARILRYVADQPGGQNLLPDSPAARVKMNEWVDKADGVNMQVLSYSRHGIPRATELLDARIAKAAENKYRYPELADVYEQKIKHVLDLKLGRVDEAQVKEIEEKANRHINELEKVLQEALYIAGQTYTIADVMWTVLLARFEMIKLEELISAEQHPAVAAYYARMKARPSFKSAKVNPEWVGGI